MSNDEKKYDETDPTQNPAHVDRGNIALSAAQKKYAEYMKQPEKKRDAFVLEKFQAGIPRCVGVAVEWGSAPAVTLHMTPTVLPLEASTRERAIHTESGLLMHELAAFDNIVQLEIEPVIGSSVVRKKAIEIKEKGSTSASAAP